jgi:hypothetical protein
LRKTIGTRAGWIGETTPYETWQSEVNFTTPEKPLGQLARPQNTFRVRSRCFVDRSYQAIMQTMNSLAGKFPL